MKNKLLWFSISILVFSVFMRLLPHAPNFVPIGALAFFAGVYLPKRWGMAAPLGVMFVSDFFIGFYDWRLMAVVYGSFAAMVVVGWLVRRNKNVATIAVGALSGSIFFFLTTNFAVWALSSWYPPTFEGLILSYTMALPFFRNSLFGDLFYSGVFFGLYEALPVFNYYLKSVFSRVKVLA